MKQNNSVSFAKTSNDFKYISPRISTLSNGIRIVLCPLPHLHSVGMGLYVRIGSRYESNEENGISHFLEHVLFRGNARYETSLAMNRAFEAWGGSINGFTTREYTYFFGKFHPDYIQQAIPFMGDFVHQPSFKGVETERKIILEERLEDVDENGQDLDLDDVSRLHFWDQHALGQKIIGCPHAIRSITQEQLLNHFTNHYCGDNLVFCLTGCFHIEEALPLIEKSFSQLPSKEEMKKRDVQSLPTAPSKQSAFVTHDSSQVSLQFTFLGFSPSDRKFHSAMLLDRILDDGMSSRLWQKIIEEKGLCYELWSGLDVYHDMSLLDIGASVAPEKALLLIELILKELEQLKVEGPVEEEFELARRRWQFSQEYVLDQVESLNERLAVSVLYNRYVSFEEQMDIMSSLDLDEFQNVCKSILSKERCLFTAIGPLTKNMKKKLRMLRDSLST